MGTWNILSTKGAAESKRHKKRGSGSQEKQEVQAAPVQVHLMYREEGEEVTDRDEVEEKGAPDAGDSSGEAPWIQAHSGDADQGRIGSAKAGLAAPPLVVALSLAVSG